MNEKYFKKGTRVFHQKFGYGKIIFVEGEKAEVDFDKSSRKQVFLKYLEIMKKFFLSRHLQKVLVFLIFQLFFYYLLQ